MQNPQRTYDSIVTAVAVRDRRELTGKGMVECKRDLQRKALLKIVADAHCDAGIRFVLRALIEGVE